MGYRPPTKTLRLSFSDPEFEGLEVHMRRISVGQYREVLAVREEGQAELDTLLRLFLDAVHSWNLEDEQGSVLPRTVEAISDLDFQFVDAMCDAWMTEMQGNTAPLPDSSPAGGPSPAVSIPMEPLSESRAS